MTRHIRFGSWCFDPDTHLLTLGTEQHALEPRVSRLLEFLLEHPDETLSHDRLVDAVWDGRVVSDEAVRRAVSSLRHALAADGSDRCVRTVHKKGYVAVFEPPSSADMSEAAQATPPASARAAPRDARPAWGHVALALALVLMAGALLLALAPQRHDVGTATPPSATPAPPAPTLAVLPFQDLSTEADSKFLSDGVSEELLDTLARFHGLQVTARASAFRFRDTRTTVQELGRQLGVAYVLQGSVRRIEERVRIDCRLSDTRSGKQLWSGSYERRLDELLAMQQEIAGDVAGALELALVSPDPGPPAARTSSVEAHLELLRARERLASWAVADVEQAIDHLQRAIALDPGYAAAYAQLADAILIRALSTDSVESVRATVEALLDKALALDPGLGEAHVMRGWLMADAGQQERQARKGLALSPNYARGYEMLAGLLMNRPGAQHEALELIDRALALDPLTPRNHHIKAIMLAQRGDFAGAEALERRALELDPRFRSALMWLGKLSGMRGEFAQTVQHCERALAIDPQAVFLRTELVQSYLSVGDVAAARSVNRPATPVGELAILLLDGEWQRAVERSDAHRRGPEASELPSALSSYALLRHALAGGTAAQAAAMLRAELGFDGSMPRLGSATEARAYINLAQLLDAGGEAAAASQLHEQLGAALDALEALAPGHARLIEVNRALMLAQQQRDDAAMAALERAYAEAPLPLWWLDLPHPAFERLRAQPRFRALEAQVNAHVSKQREQLAEMRRQGLVPARGAQNQR